MSPLVEKGGNEHGDEEASDFRRLKSDRPRTNPQPRSIDGHAEQDRGNCQCDGRRQKCERVAPGASNNWLGQNAHDERQESGRSKERMARRDGGVERTVRPRRERESVLRRRANGDEHAHDGHKDRVSVWRHDSEDSPRRDGRHRGQGECE